MAGVVILMAGLLEWISHDPANRGMTKVVSFIIIPIMILNGYFGILSGEPLELLFLLVPATAWSIYGVLCFRRKIKDG